ncbi:hypothetical protein ACFWC9_40620 [Streptomyces goshikiensis]|uniref:hypothetical protein n=1 Tax=Streptomyces goshikiensis TaxID=1942 RepID=UPI00369C50BA
MDSVPVVVHRCHPGGGRQVIMHREGREEILGLAHSDRDLTVFLEAVGVIESEKTLLTGAALAATAYARMLGKKIELDSTQDPQDAEEVAGSFDTSKADRYLSYAQWLVPAVTGGLLILGALHGQQHGRAGAWHVAACARPVAAHAVRRPLVPPSA